MDCLYIFTFMLHFSAGCDLLHERQTLEVTAYSGKSVVLPCSCTEPQAKPEELKWKKYYSEIYPSEHIERFKNRVTLLNQTTPGNLSLLLSSVTKEDAGDYQCFLSSNKYIYIRLHIKGCDLLHETQTLKVTAHSGESVVLPCSCTEPQAKPEELKWMKHHSGNYRDIYPSEHIERFKNRVTLLNQTTPGNLSLLLSSLTKEDAGNYQCFLSSNKYIYIRLHITETHKVCLSTSQPSTSNKQTQDNTQHTLTSHIIIVMAVCASVLLLALLVFIFWRWKGGKNAKVIYDVPELVREPENEDEVAYSAVFHVKTSSTPASIQNYGVEHTLYTSVNVK